MKERRVASSPLAFWLDANGMTMREFSRRIGIPHSRLSGIIDGRALPGVIVAYEVERLTKGEVAMESWLGCEIGKSGMATLRAGQPKEFQSEAFKKPPSKDAEDDDDGEGEEVTFAVDR